MDTELDDIDRKIIESLRDDARCTNKRLATIAETSESTIASRIRKLVASKVVRITIEEDITQHGYDLYVVATLNVALNKRDDVARRLARIDDIQSVLTVLGSAEVLVLFFSTDQEHLDGVVDRLASTPGVLDVSVDVASKIYKYASSFGPLEQ